MVVNQIKRNHILSSMNIGRCRSNGDLKSIMKLNKGK